jgi:hypothetical protein
MAIATAMVLMVGVGFLLGMVGAMVVIEPLPRTTVGRL